MVAGHLTTQAAKVLYENEWGEVQKLQLCLCLRGQNVPGRGSRQGQYAPGGNGAGINCFEQLTVRYCTSA